MAKMRTRAAKMLRFMSASSFQVAVNSAGDFDEVLPGTIQVECACQGESERLALDRERKKKSGPLPTREADRISDEKPSMTRPAAGLLGHVGLRAAALLGLLRFLARLLRGRALRRVRLRYEQGL